LTSFSLTSVPLSIQLPAFPHPSTFFQLELFFVLPSFSGPPLRTDLFRAPSSPLESQCFTHNRPRPNKFFFFRRASALHPDLHFSLFLLGFSLSKSFFLVTSYFPRVSLPDAYAILLLSRFQQLSVPFFRSPNCPMVDGYLCPSHYLLFLRDEALKGKIPFSAKASPPHNFLRAAGDRVFPRTISDL